jgi:hypothetical protein
MSEARPYGHRPAIASGLAPGSPFEGGGPEERHLDFGRGLLDPGENELRSTPVAGLGR